MHHNTFQRTRETINTAVLIGLEKKGPAKSRLVFLCRISAEAALQKNTHSTGGNLYLRPVFALFFVLTDLIPLQVKELSAVLGNAN